MLVDEKMRIEALDLRQKIEHVIRLSLNLGIDETKLGRFLDIPKSENGKTKFMRKAFLERFELEKISKVWNIVNDILHSNIKEKLKSEDIYDVKRILQNSMKKTSNEKKEYLFNGLIYYKLIFNKQLMKQLKKESIPYNPNPRTKTEKEAVLWAQSNNIFIEFLENDIFIQKEYFDSLNDNPQKIDCMILPKDENQFSEYICVSIRESFDINKMSICCKGKYDHCYNKDVEESCINILVDIEKGEKIEYSQCNENNNFREYVLENGLVYYRVNETDGYETFFILREHYLALKENDIASVRMEYTPNYENLDEDNFLDITSSTYYFCKKFNNDCLEVVRINSSQYLIWNDEYFLGEVYQVESNK